MNDYDYNSTELLRLQTATQITTALIVKGGMDSKKTVDIALKYTNTLMKKLEEEGAND